jgi:hypothetical protein
MVMCLFFLRDRFVDVTNSRKVKENGHGTEMQPFS